MDYNIATETKHMLEVDEVTFQSLMDELTTRWCDGFTKMVRWHVRGYKAFDVIGIEDEEAKKFYVDPLFFKSK